MNLTSLRRLENLTNGTSEHEEEMDGSTENKRELFHKNHSNKKRLANGTSLPVEPAEKVK